MPSPRPESAPHLPATVCTIHNENRKPIQLNRNDTENIHLLLQKQFIKFTSWGIGRFLELFWRNFIKNQNNLIIRGNLFDFKGFVQAGDTYIWPKFYKMKKQPDP